MNEFNPTQEFDPTNPNDPNYDPTLHAQAEENRQNDQVDPGAQPSQEQPEVTPPAPVQPADVNYRKESVPGLVDKPIAGVALSDEALKVKEKLAGEQRMPFFIPLDPGEKPGAYRAVTINGYRCEVKKGKMIQLPMSIAKLLMRSYNVEAEVLNENERNLNNATPEARRALGLE